jgi:methylmalonyl-CoA mutase C-terminal domain/subunit
MNGAGPRRCLLGMLGTDVHNKGVRTLARLLRDRGVEVIYVGEHHTVESMVSAAAAEDAEVVGVSFSNAAYLGYTASLVEAMRAAGLTDVPVMVGGLIHPDDVPVLGAMGVEGVFGPGSTVDEVMDYLQRIS